ncbi:mannose-6-phosphate isomerase, class I [Pseudonocardiaceae bacterium YIM PH 21723]|nr:mannose-6-phosphate isomerase, class I [Pseudonocardiaceae bacterium YIM PH 21723]
MKLLRNAVRPYAWGSRSVIAELLGRPVPTPHPEAELWLGAHPADPSRVVSDDGTETSLVDVLRADPTGQLGAESAMRWGDRLPFLMKVLAAEEPLSLQAHPSLEQAIDGFAKEEAAGLPRDAVNRNYKDANHKPELICALTEFHALAGFRAADRTVDLLDSLGVPELNAHAQLLAAQPDEDGLRALFTTWITLPQQTLDELLPALLDACVRHVRERSEWSREARTALQLGEAYPGDAGVLAALLLNHVVLEPGEAIYLPAGNLHAYLHGTGIEIMANSDNVLRGGLTPKHVDVPELLRVLDFRSGDMPVLRGEAAGPHRTVYPTPAPDFRLSRLDWESGLDREPVLLETSGPQIMLCMSGSAQLQTTDGAQKLDLNRGESLWLSATDPAVLVSPGQQDRVSMFVATPAL